MVTTSIKPKVLGTILSVDELHQYDIPEQIIEQMKTWEVIYKSPYSNSFYNTTEINWGDKPNCSLRVSDHWNFSTRKTKLTGRLHCKTNKNVLNKSKYTIGKYNSEKDSYIVLLSLNKQSNQNMIDYKRSDENIEKNRMFSNMITNSELYSSFEANGISYKGKVVKLGRSSIRIVDDNDNVIFNLNKSPKNIKKLCNFILFDKNNNLIENPYR